MYTLVVCRGGVEPGQRVVLIPTLSCTLFSTSDLNFPRPLRNVSNQQNNPTTEKITTTTIFDHIMVHAHLPTMKSRLSTVIIVFLSVVLTAADAQQLIKIFTTYATFRLQTSIPEKDVQTQQQFQFESAASKLFHNDITHRESGANDPYANSRAVLTTVQVSDKYTVNNLLTMEGVVSVTFSQVGIYKALKRSPLTGGVEEKVAPDLASLLSKVISEEELFTILVLSGIVPEGYNEDQLKVSFESYDGDFNARGMYSLGDTEIVSNGKNGGWAMFWAGVFFTLVFGGSTAVVSWLYKFEHGHWPFFPNNEESRGDIVVHHDEDEEDEDVEMIVPTNGLLGLKGHHPSAASKENSHPNSAARRRKRIGESPSSYDESAFSPNTQATPSSRHPLGIKSMRKLNTPFFTPQKPTSSRQMVLYDVERLTKSDEKSVKSNKVLFD